MRRLGSLGTLAALSIALGCGAPSTGTAAPEKTAAFVTYEVLPAADEPPGLYPGRTVGLDMKVCVSADNCLPSSSADRQEYQRYLALAKPVADDIQTRISAIRDGKLAGGCIGVDARTCIASLAQSLAIVTDPKMGLLSIDARGDSDDPLLSREKIDVNGKAHSRHDARFQAFIPFMDAKSVLPISDALSISLTLDDGRMVRSMSVVLRGDPLSAITAADYDQTGIYEVLSAVSMPACPRLQRIDVYKAIENGVKKTLVPTHTVDASMDDLSEMYGHEGKYAYCGRTLTFHTEGGNAVSAVTINNPHGATGSSSVRID